MESTDSQPPSYLTKVFLQEVLQNKLCDQKFEIVSCDMKPALAPGENYVSIIFRAKITIQKSKGTVEDISLIIKSLPPSELIQKTINDHQFYLKEAHIMAWYIPSMIKLLPTNTSKFSAKCYYFQGPPKDLIIMEDLSDLGYVLGDRKNGLDLPHTLLAIKNLAGYHAGMRTLLKKKPELKEEFKDIYWDESHNDKYEKFVRGPAQFVANNAGEWEGFPHALILKLQKLVDVVQKKQNDAWRINVHSKMNTILHGDCWANNMMFKYDSAGKVNGHVFLDFQFTNYNSSLMDFFYFMFTSVNLQVRKEHLETIKRTYYDELTSILKETEPELNLTYDEFEEEYRKKMFHAVITVMTIYPITSAEEKANVDDLLDQDCLEFKNAYLYENRRVQEFITESLIYFDENGLL